LKIPLSWKKLAARLVRWRIVQRLMSLAIRVVVPRHRMGVSLVALDEEGKILMLRHVFHPHAPWGLPGGWMGRGETPRACVLRELKEETGLAATLGPVVLVERDPKPDHLILVYMGRVRRAPISPSPEILEAAWFLPDALPEPLYPFTRLAIQNALTQFAELAVESQN
jgi:ADP-ribose pyrophosphatase YjhB (NUDIX family)